MSQPAICFHPRYGPEFCIHQLLLVFPLLKWELTTKHHSTSHMKENLDISIYLYSCIYGNTVPWSLQGWSVFIASWISLSAFTLFLLMGLYEWVILFSTFYIRPWLVQKEFAQHWSDLLYGYRGVIPFWLLLNVVCFQLWVLVIVVRQELQPKSRLQAKSQG